MDTGLIRQALALLLVFGLLGGLLWFARRRGSLLPALDRGKNPRALRPVDRLALTPHHSLHLLRVHVQGHAREIVVATHPQGCTLLNLEAFNLETASLAQSDLRQEVNR